MKAILVIDMPSDCNHCQFSDFSNGQWECNQCGERIAESMKICSTPSWCPLMPMPKESIDMSNDEEYMKHYKQGRNDVIAEIKGEIMQSFSE